MGIKRFMDYPEWNQANEKFQELHENLAQLNVEHNDIMTWRLREGKGSLSDDATNLLDGKEVIQRESTTERLAQVDRKRQVVREAISIQTRRIAELRGELSQRIIKESNIKDQYAVLVRSSLKAAEAYAEALQKEKAFRQLLINEDIAFVGRLPLCIPRGIDRAEDPLGHLDRIKKEAAEHGYI